MYKLCNTLPNTVIAMPFSPTCLLLVACVLLEVCHPIQLPPGSQSGRPGLPASFDYVVVGGGTAGLAVAWRLASNASNSVAVIEAGRFYQIDNGNLSTVPAYTSSFVGKNPTEKNPLIDWEQWTVPQAVSDIEFFEL